MRRAFRHIARFIADWMTTRRALRDPEVRETLMGTVTPDDMVSATAEMRLLTIHFEEGVDGWVTATIEEEPAAISQGRTRDEAYANVLDALHDLRHLGRSDADRR